MEEQDQENLMEIVERLQSTLSHGGQLIDNGERIRGEAQQEILSISEGIIEGRLSTEGIPPFFAFMVAYYPNTVVNKRGYQRLIETYNSLEQAVKSAGGQPVLVVAEKRELKREPPEPPEEESPLGGTIHKGPTPSRYHVGNTPIEGRLSIALAGSSGVHYNLKTGKIVIGTPDGHVHTNSDQPFASRGGWVYSKNHVLVDAEFGPHFPYGPLSRERSAGILMQHGHVTTHQVIEGSRVIDYEINFALFVGEEIIRRCLTDTLRHSPDSYNDAIRALVSKK